MKIGILVPSRERLNLKLTLISSIITTVNDINNVVLYFGIDDDDPTKETVYKIAAAMPFIRIIPIHNEGQFIGINKIWNILAAECKEDIFGYIGDDMIFRTPEWIKNFNEGAAWYAHKHGWIPTKTPDTHISQVSEILKTLKRNYSK